MRIRKVLALPLGRRLLTTLSVATALVALLAPSAWATCQSGRVHVIQAPPDQLFVLGTAEQRTVRYLQETFDDRATTCGLVAVSKVPGVILHGHAGETGTKVSLNSIDQISDPPRWFSLGIEVTSGTPAGDGVIEFRNKAGGVDGTGGPPEDLVVGVVHVHVNQPAVIVGDLVGTVALVDSADVGGRTFATTLPGRWGCPAGYRLAGAWRYTDGFWLLVVMVLAGGKGTRCWPLSCETRPKPLSKSILSDRSLLQETLHRYTFNSFIAPRNIYIISNKSNLTETCIQAQQVGIPDSNVIVDEGKEDSSIRAVFCGLQRIPVLPHGDRLIIVSMSDNIFEPYESFQSALTTALLVASSRPCMVSIGQPIDICSNRDARFGHMQYDAGSRFASFEAFHVNTFTERPGEAAWPNLVDQGLPA